MIVPGQVRVWRPGTVMCWEETENKPFLVLGLRYVESERGMQEKVCDYLTHYGPEWHFVRVIELASDVVYPIPGIPA